MDDKDLLLDAAERWDGTLATVDDLLAREGAMEFHEAAADWIEWADREGWPALGLAPMPYGGFLARLAAHRRQRVGDRFMDDPLCRLQQSQKPEWHLDMTPGEADERGARMMSAEAPDLASVSAAACDAPFLIEGRAPNGMESCDGELFYA